MSAALFRLAPLAAAMVVSACALSPAEPLGPLAKETIHAVTASSRLLSFNAGQPQKILASKALTGLRDGDRLVGIDYRVAKGQLYGLGASGQLYRIDASSAVASPIGSPATLPEGREFGFDFNPTVDRIRVVSDAGFNLRLHPDTGAVVDGDASQPGVQFDGRLAYDAADRMAGHAPRIVAAGYTYNKDNEKITTNYALDGAAGTLVHQGTKEGVAPVVSPNTGRLYTVGMLGTGPFARASLDISDISNTAYAGIAIAEGRPTRWYRIDLASGAATFIGTVGGGEPITGSAIEP
ncbi:DUF4394 domain-containing protein [Piscinibacter aquaticus]|uniref:DUF4394 domain-containing protein n=1 Tax=Piscinibacter aquaticus TaxID=392597 RepID=A0A5C6U0Q7_9BURK|nr:DUF4394 domain-containing protein [Piscinibacter aquaticus]